MIHLYIGDGKGKTTAAVGQLVRACGAGWKGIFCQFLKSGDSNELTSLSSLSSVDILSGEAFLGFFPELSETERACVAKKQLSLLRLAVDKIKLGADIAVFDEFLWLIHFGILKEEEALFLMKDLPQKTELILTGRFAPDSVIAAADYVSEIRKIRHPFDSGKNARRGIEF